MGLIGILFLPFIIVKRILWKIIWHSVYFFLKRPKLLIFVLTMLVVWIVYNSFLPLISPKNSPKLAPAAPPNIETKSQKTILPAIVGKIEDGNASFSKNLMKAMNEQQRQRYTLAFYHAMNLVPAGETYNWKSISMFGYFKMKENFVSKSGMICRKYEELISLQGHNQQFDNMACQYRNNPKNWCRLRATSTPSCEISGTPPSGFDSFSGWIKKIF